jgi:hypothetical protein
MNRYLRKFSILIAACAVSALAAAIEPPRPTVKDALGANGLAFVGRVQSLQEVERQPTHSVATATFVLLKCLYGRACRDRSTLQVRFTPETLRDGALGVNFTLGSEYLMLFKRPGGMPLAFDTEWPDKMDVAFVLKTPLQPLSALDPAGDSITFENVWGGPPQAVERTMLEDWSARRAEELGRP